MPLVLFPGAFPVRPSGREFFGGSAPGCSFCWCRWWRCHNGGWGRRVVWCRIRWRIDGVGTFRRRAGVSAGFSTGGATWTSTPGFGPGAVSLRRRFGWSAATREAFVLPGLGAGPAAPFCAGWSAFGPPIRGTPGVSSRIHFTVPLPPSVRTRFFSSRRGNSSITHRFDKPVFLASSAIWIPRLAPMGDPAFGTESMRINTRYNLASPAGMTFSSHSRSISADMLAGLGNSICSGLIRLGVVHGEPFK